ncbi:MAG: hypothetical protein ACI35Z_04215 [Sphingobacterium hotanense]
MDFKKFSKLISIEIIIQELIHLKYPTSELSVWTQYRSIILENSIQGIKEEMKATVAERNTIESRNEAYYFFYQKLASNRQYIQNLPHICSSVPVDEYKEFIHLLKTLEDFFDFFENDFSLSPALCNTGSLEKVVALFFEDIAQTIKLFPRHILTTQLINGCLKILTLAEDNPMRTFYDCNYFFWLFRVGTTWDWHRQIGCLHAIERFVIYLNFNTEDAINYFLEKVKNELEQMSLNNQQIRLLLDYHRSLAQVPARRNTPYHKHGVIIKKHLSNWIKTELKFRYEAPTVGLGNQSDLPKIPVSLSRKVVCKLSGDQIAIVLRAADEIKMIESRSLNMVYKTLIPYIATERMTTLSPASIRIKSYHPECKDKDLVINKLNQMIQKIKDY